MGEGGGGTFNYKFMVELIDLNGGVQQIIWVVGQGKCIPFPHIVISGIALKSEL